MEIHDIPIEKLKAYERNPRKNDAAAASVAASIEAFGFKVPIAVDRNDVIVCGHTRLKAAKSLGIETVPCIEIAEGNNRRTDRRFGNSERRFFISREGGRCHEKGIQKTLFR